MNVTDEMVDRFLSWPVPDSVCVDGNCARQGKPGDSRVGTNLLTAVEARAMLEHVLATAGWRCAHPLCEVTRPHTHTAEEIEHFSKDSK